MQVAGCAHLHTTLNKSRDEKLDLAGTAPPYELGKRVVDMVYTLYLAPLAKSQRRESAIRKESNRSQGTRTHKPWCQNNEGVVDSFQHVGIPVAFS